MKSSNIDQAIAFAITETKFYLPVVTLVTFGLTAGAADARTN